MTAAPRPRRIVKKTTATPPTTAQKEAAKKEVFDKLQYDAHLDIDKEAGRVMRNSGGIKKGEKVPPPKLTAKVLTLRVSCGNENTQTLDELSAAIVAAVSKVVPDVDLEFPDGKGGKNKFRTHHVTVHGGYYILDGKVCLPEDYDPKTKNFKVGATPPSWAGGPDPAIARRRAQETADAEKRLTAEEGRLRIQEGRAKNGLDPLTGKPLPKEVEDLDVEWEDIDIEDIDDDALGKVADRDIEAATKRMQSAPKIVRRTTKKVAEPEKKRTVRRTASNGRAIFPSAPAKKAAPAKRTVRRSK